MQPIPTPQVLDPDRVLANDRGDLTVDHEARANLLDEAIHDTCAYAQQLWHDIDAIRAYLLTSLPPDPRAPGTDPTASASPTGPDDTDGWDNWIAAYASVTSVLCGPHGDSGYGLGEARREATLRRTAPILRIEAEHPELHKMKPPPSAPETKNQPLTQPPAPSGSRAARSVATAVLILLALRGLRPRGGTFTS